jgi:hypothetical protein
MRKMPDKKGSQRIQLSAKEMESAKQYLTSARESLGRLSQLTVGKLDNHNSRVAGFKIGIQAIEEGHGPADLLRFRPEVVVFEDEDGNCVGMYVDPPGICTDEC